MGTKRHILIGVTVAALTGGATTAIAASEHANLIPAGAPSGYLAINPQTCKFIHPEIDVRPSATERYARAEDARDDAKLSCLTRKIDSAKVVKPGALNYKSVTATGTGATVTAQCPAGYYVTGGGSHSEVTGSYPTGNDAWVVGRDARSPRVLDVTAICVQYTP